MQQQLANKNVSNAQKNINQLFYLFVFNVAKIIRYRTRNGITHSIPIELNIWKQQQKYVDGDRYWLILY